MNDPSAEELSVRYESLYPGAVVDVLDDRGLVDQTLRPEITPLRDGMTTAGVAYPVVGRPNRSVDPEENMRKILRMLGEAPEHAVVTYQTNDTGDAAHLGELSVVALKSRAVRGAVLDGGVRDVSYILSEDFPVFSRYRTPADAVPRWEILEWGEQAVVGGIEINAGDIVVGDEDGVAVVPKEIRLAVLEEAEELAETEDEVREAVRSGTAPLDAYDEYGVF
ncbi:RraA family protein [Halopenitus sp. H-Gu1]|uniref:RraA family protein n=1 Tax=Halopenitus sp. H-Gu1 TaxID=3242697 RepID=UPI00359E7AB8